MITEIINSLIVRLLKCKHLSRSTLFLYIYYYIKRYRSVKQVIVPQDICLISSIGQLVSQDRKLYYNYYDISGQLE